MQRLLRRRPGRRSLIGVQGGVQRSLLCLLAVVLCACGGARDGAGAAPGGSGTGPGTPAEIVSVRADGATLQVQYMRGRCTRLVRSAALAEQGKVRIVLRLEGTGETCVAVLEVQGLVLPLDAPLGDRMVIDENGTQVPTG